MDEEVLTHVAREIKKITGSSNVNTRTKRLLQPTSQKIIKALQGIKKQKKKALPGITKGGQSSPMKNTGIDEIYKAFEVKFQKEMKPPQIERIKYFEKYSPKKKMKNKTLRTTEKNNSYTCTDCGYKTSSPFEEVEEDEETYYICPNCEYAIPSYDYNHSTKKTSIVNTTETECRSL